MTETKVNLKAYPEIALAMEEGLLIEKPIQMRMPEGEMKPHGLFVKGQEASGPLLMVMNDGMLGIRFHDEIHPYCSHEQRADGALLIPPASAEECALIGQSHRYDKAVKGHSWVNIYIPNAHDVVSAGGASHKLPPRLNKELHHSKLFPSVFADTPLDMLETLFLPSSGVIVEDLVQPEGQYDMVGLTRAVLMPVSTTCALNLAMDGFVQSMLQQTKRGHDYYQALPVLGRNCSRGGHDFFRQLGFNPHAHFSTHAFSLSPMQFGEALKSLPRDASGPRFKIEGMEGCVHVRMATTQQDWPAIILDDNGLCEKGYMKLGETMRIELTTDYLLHHMGKDLCGAFFNAPLRPVYRIAPDFQRDQSHIKGVAGKTYKQPFGISLGLKRHFTSGPHQEKPGSYLG